MVTSKNIKLIIRVLFSIFWGGAMVSDTKEMRNGIYCIQYDGNRLGRLFTCNLIHTHGISRESTSIGMKSK